MDLFALWHRKSYGLTLARFPSKEKSNDRPFGEESEGLYICHGCKLHAEEIPIFSVSFVKRDGICTHIAWYFAIIGDKQRK